MVSKSLFDVKKSLKKALTETGLGKKKGQSIGHPDYFGHHSAVLSSFGSKSSAKCSARSQLNHGNVKNAIKIGLKIKIIDQKIGGILTLLSKNVETPKIVSGPKGAQTTQLNLSFPMIFFFSKLVDKIS
jgi:hypothetical protein